MTEDKNEKDKKKKIEFSKYSIKKSDISNRIPDNISFNKIDVESKVPNIRFNEFSVDNRINNLSEIDGFEFNKFEINPINQNRIKKDITFNKFSVDEKLNNTSKIDEFEFNKFKVEVGQPKLKIIPPDDHYNIDMKESENLVATRETKVKCGLSNNEILAFSNINQNFNEGRNAKYTARELIEDLMVEIQKYSEDLAILFPKRLFKVNSRSNPKYYDAKYSLSMLSRFWGYPKHYVKALLANDNRVEDFRISIEDLSKLRQKIHDHLGERESICLEIIDEYENSKLNLREFVISLRFELGRISGKIIFTQDEASQILGIDVNSKLSLISKSYPNYRFSLWRLDDMIERIGWVFGEKAENCYKLIQKYKDLNKDLKEYEQQKHNVGKPHYFENILLGEIEKAYIFGFLGHDGFTTGGYIGLRINPKDKVIIDKLIYLIDLDKSKVKITPEIILQIYKGERKEYKSLRLRFGCKPMVKELEELGDIGSGSAEKEVPLVIKKLINVAKQKTLDEWMDTIEGKTALAWLLGFYDADGSLKSHYTGFLYSSVREYLNEIKELFEINTKVNELKEAGFREVFDRISLCKGNYQLTISSRNVMIKMMEIYPYSLDRKRPEKYRLSSSDLDNYLGSFK